MPETLPGRPDPDQAWKALSLVNEWLRHAEAKLGLTLAATGVSGGVLFNLVNNRGETSLPFDVLSVVCAAAALLAGGFSVIGLFPIVQVKRRSADAEVNPLFFHDVARAYRGKGPSYGHILHTLTTNDEDLVRHIAQQLHSNSGVAQRKYKWANWALRALLVDISALACVAAIVSLNW